MTTANEMQGYPWEETKPKKSKKPVLIVAGVLTLLSVGVIAILAFMLTGNSPSPTTLAKCDTWMRQQLVAVPDAAANAANANTVVAYVQSQRPDSCPPSTWNPLVNDVARDDEGNIDIIFSTTTGNTGGTAVTMPADGNPGWAYSADQNTWGPRQQTPDQTRPTYTPHPGPNYTQPNAATTDPDDYIELGNHEWFSGQALAEANRGLELFDPGGLPWSHPSVPISSNPPRQAFISAGKPDWNGLPIFGRSSAGHRPLHEGNRNRRRTSTKDK